MSADRREAHHNTTWVPPAPDDLPAELERVWTELAALPPVVTRIDAPSTILAALRRALELPGQRTLSNLDDFGPVAVASAARCAAIPLHVDNELPAHTVRLTWSDGRRELRRL